MSDTWQPIETAPKGQDVLVGMSFGDGWQMHVAVYEVGHWWCMGYRIKPTHWMPLPEPPVKP